MGPNRAWPMRARLRPVLEPDVQVVRFQGPPGLTVEVLAPGPIPVPVGDGARNHHGRPQARSGVSASSSRNRRASRWPSYYPVVEVVGHLHRPEGIDPGKYPIRVVFNQDDMDDAVDRGRLVTKVIYLEDPDQAIPFKMAKDEISVVTLNPTEPPLRVASALGRPVAIVRIGGRRPTEQEIQGAVAGDIGLDWVESIWLQTLPVPVPGRRPLFSCLAGQCASLRHRQPGPRCPATNTCATAATGRLPRRPTPTAGSPAWTRATRSSASISGS